MRLLKYVEAKGINLDQMAAHCGVSRRTLQRIIDEEVACQLDNAYAIVLASKARPATGGGVIPFQDLIAWDRKLEIEERFAKRAKKPQRRVREGAGG